MSESGAEKFNLNGVASRKPNGNHHLNINGQANVKRAGLGSNIKNQS